MVLQFPNAFTGTYGINYGRLADNIPSPEKAFSGTGLELVVGLPNGYVQDMSANPDHALNWVKDNIQSFLPATNIVGIAVGNEVLGGGDSDLSENLLGAMKNIYNATKALKLHKKIQISTAHSAAVFNTSYPPSSGSFKESINEYMKPLLEFTSKINSPFCLNAYPFLAYMSDPDHIDLNYALFKNTSGISDPNTNLHYDNMLDAIVDATYAALEDVGYKKMEVVITETGWASKGDQNEGAATLQNARTYNYNLRKRLALRKGTPLRPHILVRAYIFALFNEDSKPGPTSERNFGLFKPDGSIVYNIGLHGIDSSAASSSRLSNKGMRCHFGD
ncbi:hypothetical protein V2J09_010322 [Rumex salicifolius]